MVIVLVPMEAPFLAYQRILVPPPRRFLEEITTGFSGSQQLFAKSLPKQLREMGVPGTVPATESVGMTRSGSK
jgi:hypothetical protein